MKNNRRDFLKMVTVTVGSSQPRCMQMKNVLFTVAVIVTQVFATYDVFGVDWFQWRGPNHNDISPEKSGWRRGWPPKRLWGRNVGPGCSSPIIVGGRLYVTGWKGNRKGRNPKGTDTVYCFQAATGKELWKQNYPCRYQGRLRSGDEQRYGGPSSTPTLDRQTAYLYTLSIDGDIRCWDTRRKGRLVWSMNFYDRYKVGQRPRVTGGLTKDYGYSSSPLIQGNLLIMEVGDNEGTLMAFNKKTGKRVWTSACKEPAGHNAGPVPMTIQGIPCIVSFGIRKLLVVRTDKGHQGKTVAMYNWETSYANNITTPAVIDNKVILTSGYNQHRTSLLEISLKSVRQRWRAGDHSLVSSPVIYKNRVYIADSSLVCLDLASGKRRWRGGSFRHGSCLVTAGDDKLIVFASGRLALVEASPGATKYRELSRVDRIVKDTCYPHVALSDGIICCKDKAGNLVCFSVRNK